MAAAAREEARRVAAGRPRSPRPRTSSGRRDRRRTRRASPGRPRRRGFRRRPSRRLAAACRGASSPRARVPTAAQAAATAAAAVAGKSQRRRSGTTVAVRGSALAASRMRSRSSGEAPALRRRRRARRQSHARWPPPRGIGRRCRGAARTSSGPRDRGRRARTRRLGRGSRTGPCASFLFARPSPVVRSAQLPPGEPRPDRREVRVRVERLAEQPLRRRLPAETALDHRAVEVAVPVGEAEGLVRVANRLLAPPVSDERPRKDLARLRARASARSRVGPARAIRAGRSRARAGTSPGRGRCRRRSPASRLLLPLDEVVRLRGRLRLAGDGVEVAQRGRELRREPRRRPPAAGVRLPAAGSRGLPRSRPTPRVRADCRARRRGHCGTGRRRQRTEGRRGRAVRAPRRPMPGSPHPPPSRVRGRSCVGRSRSRRGTPVPARRARRRRCSASARPFARRRGIPPRSGRARRGRRPSRHTQGPCPVPETGHVSRGQVPHGSGGGCSRATRGRSRRGRRSGPARAPVAAPARIACSGSARRCGGPGSAPRGRLGRAGWFGARGLLAVHAQRAADEESGGGYRRHRCPGQRPPCHGFCWPFALSNPLGGSFSYGNKPRFGTSFPSTPSPRRSPAGMALELPGHGALGDVDDVVSQPTPVRESGDVAAEDAEPVRRSPSAGSRG